MRGATADHHTFMSIGIVSIHAPHAGRDSRECLPRRCQEVSIHAPHAGRDRSCSCSSVSVRVSIHAPHAGRDNNARRCVRARFSFNPRAPCGARLVVALTILRRSCFNPRAPCGARLPIQTVSPRLPGFQSTRPMRGATVPRGAVLYHYFVSIHAPHAGRDGTEHDFVIRFCVSIHAPHAGRDYHHQEDQGGKRVSIHAPHAGRDSICSCQRMIEGVSIHAPHAGRDRALFGKILPVIGFNPRAPCGARRQLESRLPPFATYLWAFPSTNTIFSAPKSHAPPAA